MLNTLIITGRIVRDIDLKSVGSKGTDLANVTIANNYWGGNENKSVFVECVVWGKQALTLAKFCRKGDAVTFEGTLIDASYTKNDGTKVYKNALQVKAIHFENNKKNDNNENVGYDPTIKPTGNNTFASEFASDNLIIDNDELPF